MWIYLHAATCCSSVSYAMFFAIRRTARVCGAIHVCAFFLHVLVVFVDGLHKQKQTCPSPSAP